MGPGWVLETVITDKTGVGQIARQHVQAFKYHTQYYPYYHVNVRQCDGGVLFGPATHGKYQGVKRELERSGKPFIENPTVAELQDFILTRSIRTLFVYGPDLKPVREQVDTVLAQGLLPF